MRGEGSSVGRDLYSIDPPRERVARNGCGSMNGDRGGNYQPSEPGGVVFDLPWGSRRGDSAILETRSIVSDITIDGLRSLHGAA